MKTSRSFLAAFAACFLCVAAALAGDPSGTWRWTVNTPNGDIETTLNLTLKDGQLSGTYSNSFGSVAISSATFKDDAIAFKVEREFDGNKFVLSYAGKLSGDTITGNIEVPGFGGGEGNKIDWHAKRDASAAEKP